MNKISEIESRTPRPGDYSLLVKTSINLGLEITIKLEKTPATRQPWLAWPNQYPLPEQPLMKTGVVKIITYLPEVAF